MIMRIKPRNIGLFAAAGFMALGLQAGTTTVITVTTFADEDGNNTSACSLREAIAVVNDTAKAAFGGCSAGSRTGTNLIQLDAGTYTLDAAKGELLLKAPVSIAGKDTVQTDVVDAYTGVKPHRLQPLTTIDAGGHSRIISTGSIAGVAISLKDVILANGSATNVANNMAKGGAIYVSGSISLDNTVIKNSTASGTGTEAGSGGAIFLAQHAASLTMTDSTLSNNHATGKGGAVAMVCSQDGAFAEHAIAISRSALIANDSDSGAGAIETCGASTLTLLATTLSQNSSAAGSAVLSYVAPQNDVGAVTITYTTAAENSGPVFNFANLSSVSLVSSVVLYNGGGCTATTTVPNAVSSNYNVLDTTSCSALLGAGGHNDTNAPAGAPVANDSSAGELLVLGDYGGLTKSYLPNLNSLWILDKGPEPSQCSNTDQRNLARTSGTMCDRGAVERLKVTANADTAESGRGTDRKAIVDVLANDKFGETSSGALTFKKDGSGSYHDAVLLQGAPTPKCLWDTPENPGKLTVSNNHVLTGSTSPVICTYKVVDSGGNTSADATVTVSIKNVNPVASSDSYVRPVGTASISFNPLLNDNDNGDLDSTATSFPPTVWPTYPIYVSPTDKPKQGKIVAPTGHCPDWTGTNPKLCYQPPLQYVANDAMSPFSDSFVYTAIDSDGGSSGGATVTINTDAPDNDKGQGGSLDIFAGLAIMLLGLRRARML